MPPSGGGRPEKLLRPQIDPRQASAARLLGALRGMRQVVCHGGAGFLAIGIHRKRQCKRSHVSTSRARLVARRQTEDFPVFAAKDFGEGDDVSLAGMKLKNWWQGPELNRRHKDFQSTYSPMENMKLYQKCCKYDFFVVC